MAGSKSSWMRVIWSFAIRLSFADEILIVMSLGDDGGSKWDGSFVFDDLRHESVRRTVRVNGRKRAKEMGKGEWVACGTINAIRGKNIRFLILLSVSPSPDSCSHWASDFGVCFRGKSSSPSRRIFGTKNSAIRSSSPSQPVHALRSASSAILFPMSYSSSFCLSLSLFPFFWISEGEKRALMCEQSSIM